MELLQVLRHGSDIPTADGTSQCHDFPFGFDALEDAFAETDQHGTRLVRRDAAVRQHGETDAHQASDQVTGHSRRGVIEHFVIGLKEDAATGIDYLSDLAETRNDIDALFGAGNDIGKFDFPRMVFAVR